jgi:hypothetical protein
MVPAAVVVAVMVVVGVVVIVVVVCKRKQKKSQYNTGSAVVVAVKLRQYLPPGHVHPSTVVSTVKEVEVAVVTATPSMGVPGNGKTTQRHTHPPYTTK